MTPLRGTILLASLATFGAVLGGLAGATIGFIAPGYYRVIFEDGLMPAVDPIQVGAGLGAGQGPVLDSYSVFCWLHCWPANRFGSSTKRPEPTPRQVGRLLAPG